MKLYLEPETHGLDRRVFRYESNLIESYIEFAYHADWKAHGERARWYGFANREMPEGVKEIVWSGD